jgi:proline iminopeptidase
MTDLYPPTGPYDTGFLDTGDGNLVYYEQIGNPEGRPALNVHGGPGAGTPRWPVRAWDPSHWRLVRFDQRGCGRSTPHASDPAADMSRNTTWHLVEDMERLRTHLGVDTWVLNGGSWGTTLALAYAQRHPERVRGILLQSLTTSRRSEIDWLYRGAGRFRPEEWRRFRDGVPRAERDGDLVAAYVRLMEDPDRAVRQAAAARWLEWEEAVVSGEPQAVPGLYSGQDAGSSVAFVRICAHFFHHAAWLAEDQLLRDAHRLAGIPGSIVHGRHDLSCPVGTAWELAGAWPDARLTVFEDAGHIASEPMRAAAREAVERFKSL